MPEGDGGHIWPFRDQDPRYKCLVPTKDKDLQTDTKEALIADLGLSGSHYSLDDLWARKKIDAEIPDTSEPFDGNICGASSDWAPPGDMTPSGIHYTEVQLEGAGGICNNHTTHRITGIDVSPDGLSVMVSNTSDDVARSYLLSAAYEYDTVILNTGADGVTNPISGQWVGNHWMVEEIDKLLIRTGAGQFDIGSADVLHSSLTKVTAGFTGSADGRGWFNSSGTRVYYFGQISTTNYLRTFTTVAYDLDTASLENSVTVNPPIINVGGDLQVSPDESKIYFFGAGVLYLGTMSTPGDITTLSWSAGVNFNTVFGTASLKYIHVHTDAQQVTFCKDTTNAPEIWVADMNFTG